MPAGHDPDAAPLPLTHPWGRGSAGAGATRAVSPTARRWLVLGKLALVLVGLALLVRWALAGIAPDGRPPPLAPWALVGGVLLNQAALFAAALRLRATLAAFGVRIGAGQAMDIHLRSLFYFFFVPLSVGLEVARFIAIRRIDPSVPAGRLILVLLLDRVLGLVTAVLALLALAGVVLPASFWAGLDPHWLAAGAGIALLGGAGGLAYAGLRARLGALARLVRAGSARLLLPVVLSLLALALVCLAVWAVAAGSGWDAGLAPVSFALSASLLAMTLPVSLFGATLGEPAGVGVLALLGLTPALAVLLMALAYVGRLLGAMQGALLELYGGLRRGRQPVNGVVVGDDHNHDTDHENYRNRFMTDPARTRTIEDFGAQWTRFTDNSGYYGSLALFADIAAPLLTPADVTGRRVADVGSGTGRIVAMLLAADAAEVTAIEPSRAFEVLSARFAGEPRVRCHQAPGEGIAGLGPFDLVVSFGVLHHIPEPLPVLRAIRDALKPGGRLFAWLYGREGNGLYLALVTPLRALTRRLPDRVLEALVRVLDLPLAGYIRLCRHLPLPMAAYMREHLGRLAPDKRRLTIFDQLNPSYAKYYRRDEVAALFAAAGFTDIQLHHRHGYSWSVIGTRPGHRRLTVR